MKIIRVTSCNDCPNFHFESPNCGNDYLYCDETGVALAKEKKVIIKEAVISSLTRTVTPQVEEWKFVQDDGMIFDGSKIYKLCPLEDGSFYKEWLIELRNDLYEKIDENRLLYEQTKEQCYSIREAQIREIARSIVSVIGS